MAESASSGDSSSSKSLLWMTLAVFAGLGVLVGGGLFMADRVVQSLGISAASNKGTIHTPVGSYRMEKEEQVGLGMAVYPGSALELPDEKSAGRALQDRTNGISTVIYQSADSRDTVDEWYKKHLSTEFARHDSADKPLPEVFRDTRVMDSDIAFIAQKGEQVRIVALSLDSSGTKVSLIRYAGHNASTQPAATPAQ